MTLSNISKTLVTTACGTFGGVSKALTILPLSITLSGAVEVACYAALSATVGYGVKCLLDRWVRQYRRKKQVNKRKF